MTLFQLSSFCTVAESGSFRAAAEKMYISQPSVSQHIASLENHFGVRLFNRQKRRIRLTPEGRLLYTVAREILDRLEDVTGRIEGLRSLESGTLNLGCTPAMEAGPVPGILAEYAEAFPGVNLSLKTRDMAVLIDGLRSSDIELVLSERNLASPLDADIASQVIGRDPLVFITGRGQWPSEGEGPVEPKDLEGLPLISWSENVPFKAYLEDFSLRHQLRFSIRARSDTPRALVELVAGGLGIGLVNESAATADIEAGRVRVIPLNPSRSVSVDILALFHQTQGLTYAGWEMLKLLENRLGPV